LKTKVYAYGYINGTQNDFMCQTLSRLHLHGRPNNGELHVLEKRRKRTAS